jgi:protein-disulfide isomerase
MKSCPQCNKEYADDSLRFCLEDGAKLVKVSQPPATLRYSQGSPAKEPTMAAGSQPPSPVAGAQPSGKRILPVVIIVVVLLAALGLAAVFMRSARQPTNANANTNATSSGSEAIPPGAEPPWVRGNPNAPVMVEEFADFQCPSCGVYYPELKKIESEFGDKLRVVFRERPLVPPHEHALLAAQAAEAAGLQGHFWEMHDKLYENQTTWSTTSDLIPVFVDYAKQIGLDADRFMKDLNGETVATRIFQDGKRVHALNVNSTPTFYVNGKEAKDDNWKPDGLREMIRQALREAGK